MGEETIVGETEAHYYNCRMRKILRTENIEINFMRNKFSSAELSQNMLKSVIIFIYSIQHSS